MKLNALYKTRLSAAIVFAAAALLAGCAGEPIGDPWITAEQNQLLDGQVERDAEVASELRDRLATSQGHR